MVKMVHVCLVSEQPIPNMTTILQYCPDTVVLLYTDQTRAVKQRLAAAIKARGIAVDALEIKAFDMKDVTSKAKSVIEKYRDSELSLNITGGTKIGTLGVFQVFSQAGVLIHYVNTHGNEILRLHPDEASQPIRVNIPIREYLALHGFAGTSYTDTFTDIVRRRNITFALKNLVIRMPVAIGELNEALQKACPGSNTEKASYPLTIMIKDHSLIKLEEALRSAGIISVSAANKWVVADRESADYLHGFWFEEYVCLCAIEAGADEVLLNVKGTWDSVGSNPPRNEFDVMIGKGNRLFFISCKTAYPDRRNKGDTESISKEYLYELDSLGHKALGLFGKKMLASARPITNKYVLKRAETMNIKLVHGREIKNLKEIITEWIN